MLGEILGTVGGSLLSNLFEGDDAAKADAERAKISAMYGDLLTPQYNDYIPSQYELQGTLNPEMAKATTISEDPLVKQQQLEALSQLSGLSQTGLTDVDQANFRQAQTDAGRMARGSREALQTSAAARGMGNSGLNFALQEQGNQEAASRAMQAELSRAATSAQEKAAYQMAYGNGLSNLRNQDFNASSANSNILNEFNMANTKAANAAQQANLAARQQVSNANTETSNQAKQYANQMKQQAYNDQMQKVNGAAGASKEIASQYDRSAAASQNKASGLGALAGGAVGSMLGGSKDAKTSDKTNLGNYWNSPNPYA